MSRGLGKSQRLIIDTLEKFGSFHLNVLADGDTMQYKSLNRAAHRLADANVIDLATNMFGKHLTVCHALQPCPDHDVIRRNTDMIKQYRHRKNVGNSLIAN